MCTTSHVSQCITVSWKHPSNNFTTWADSFLLHIANKFLSDIIMNDFVVGFTFWRDLKDIYLHLVLMESSFYTLCSAFNAISKWFLELENNDAFPHHRLHTHCHHFCIPSLSSGTKQFLMDIPPGSLIGPMLISGALLGQCSRTHIRPMPIWTSHFLLSGLHFKTRLLDGPNTSHHIFLEVPIHTLALPVLCLCCWSPTNIV